MAGPPATGHPTARRPGPCRRRPRTRPRRCSPSGQRGPGCRRRRPRRSRSSGSSRGPASVSGARTSTERGPWIAHRAVARERSSRIARKRVDPLGEQVADQGSVAGVGHDQEPLLGQAVDDQVIEDPAVRGADHRVVGPADREAGRLRDDGRGQRLGRLGPLDEQLAHVGQIEQAGPLADGPVLLEDAGVLERHLPAAERGQLRPGRLVPPDQRRGVDLGLGVGRVGLDRGHGGS